MQDNNNADDKQQAENHAGETRPQQGGEGGTTRFGMEDGDNTDVPATGLDPDAQSKPPA
ncbi:hypothetical protein [Sphingomonas mucosissima]|uniref:Uncharacterized protein n=1 Tax=Sphingomonas mucosissima TaxID=370959 RepID=A0A245ZJD5_9SPHN|nr:hypothetical protein [Sphingomonas mucosissima]OWK29836.1 hypothetical protein SPMU_22580 [Sphingomonas mucosissima]